MRNSRTPYGCTICRKEFSSLICLKAHVEWRHPSEQQTQTLPKTSIGSQSGQSKQQGQQPLRSVHAIRKHFKRLTSAVGFANET